MSITRSISWAWSLERFGIAVRHCSQAQVGRTSRQSFDRALDSFGVGGIRLIAMAFLPKFPLTTAAASRASFNYVMATFAPSAVDVSRSLRQCRASRRNERHFSVALDI
jgi:hypothetical protein